MLLRCITIVIAALFAAGCNPPKLTQVNSDADIRSTLASTLQQGMTVEQVKVQLRTLNLQHDPQMLYPPTATRPQVLLVRLWPPGGAWLNRDGFLEWVDVSLVFDPTDQYRNALLFRDSVSYTGDGIPMYGPSRPALAPVPQWPSNPPPPADPLQGAT